MPRHRGTRTRRWGLPLVSGAMAACLLVGVGVAVLLGGSSEGAPAADTPPVQVIQTVHVTDTRSPIAATQDEEHPGEPGPGTPDVVSAGRVVIPGLINVDLRTMGVTDGIVNPPSSAAMFLVEGPGYGTPHTASTTYLAVHTSRWQTGEAIGDALFDGRAPAIAPGASIHVDGVEFIVSEVLNIPKSELPTTERLWGNSAADLIVLTCQQTGWGGASSENLVVLADRKG